MLSMEALLWTPCPATTMAEGPQQATADKK